MARRVIFIEQGTVEGVLSNNPEGEYYFAYRGIPYAKPPLGPLRFKAPEPPLRWEGKRDASKHGHACPQYNERMDRIEIESEDCLYLNIYRPVAYQRRPLPVMVWIHGGSFYTGSGNSDFYGPEFFMAHEILLVTFNYRLGVFGFLCLNTEEVPGNAGLKDQVAALIWINKNISKFGGDPDNVTIFGCSAGAACVSYHLISEMSKGLFHRAICQSGNCLHEWSQNIYCAQRSFQLGKLLGKETNDPKELLNFLRDVPTEELVNIKLPSLNVEYKDLTDSILFGPVVEKNELKVTKFLDKSPVDLVNEGRLVKVPLILGCTSGEGIEIARNIYDIVSFLNEVGAVVPRELKLKMTKEEVKVADRKIRDRYFDGREVTKKMYQEVSDFATDMLFLYNTYRFARKYSACTKQQVFVYTFLAETERNIIKKMYNMYSVKGVCHADELPYMFNLSCFDIKISEESRKIIRQLVLLWITFAKTGNPSPAWKPFTSDEHNCLLISDNVECVKDVVAETIEFWDEIYGYDEDCGFTHL